ncbi:MAG: 16S rRNA (guanine(966)-N(2))-methyltransferase RsmD [Candidatus Tritonobacter lacicola]|nr:16S rRNA (guanine(966)-N(2))-methyltransferase RsmD [Candidatus Tritonobacter lacicola]
MGEIRITGGEFRGRKIKVPRGVRPTSARLREALFSILGERVLDAVVLDLFAGSGALGLEALSRGARYAVFAEKGGGQVEVLRRNIASLGLRERARAVRGNWRRIVARLSEEERRKFDLVLADPPYGFWEAGNAGTKLLRLSTDFDIVAGNGILVVERPARAPLQGVASGFESILERAYGDSMLSFYHKGGSA